MSLLKKILLATAIVLPLALLAGLKLWTESSARDVIQQVIDTARPAVAIHYAQLNTSMWSGSATLEEVDIRPAGFVEDIHAKAIDIRTPGIFWLLMRAGRDTASGTLPEKLSISISGFALSLYGEQGDLISRYAGLYLAGDPPAMPHCGDRRGLDAAAYRQMGYEKLDIDATLDYAFEAKRKRARIAFEARVPDAGTLRVGTVLDSAPSGLSFQAPAGHPKEVYAMVRDQGYVERLKKFCAQASNTTVENFVEAEAGTAAFFLRQWGVEPGAALAASYRDFLTKPESFQVDVLLPPSVDLRNISLYKTTDMVDMLSLQLSLNGKPVEGAEFKFPKFAQEAAAASQKEKAANSSAAAAKKAAASAEFHEVPKSELKKHVGRLVQLYLTKSDVRQAVLEDVVGGIAVMRRDYGAGGVALEIPLRDVESVKVKY